MTMRADSFGWGLQAGMGGALALVTATAQQPGNAALSAESASPAAAAATGEIPAQPNILVIYADDLGFGDVGINGAKTIPTPHIDGLAREGINFRDGHAAAATCTPSRFALLTGRYPIRQAGTGIAAADDPLIIKEDTPTLPGLLQGVGYETAVFGKWHLGLGDGTIDWNQDIIPSPNDRGFDYSFIMPATQDRVPTVYLENHRVLGLNPKDPLRVSYRGEVPEWYDEPLGRDQPEMLIVHPFQGHSDSIHQGIGRIGYQDGGHAARWQDQGLSDTFSRRAQLWIERQAEVDGPFFAFYAATEPHVPRTPNPRFVGMTPHGVRGDAIVQFDAQVGDLVAALERSGQRDNTLIVISSDNGGIVLDGYTDDGQTLLGDHKPNGPWRGGKYALYEGGTRVPFIANWPGVIQPATSDALVGQVDFLPSFAKLAGAAVPETLLDGVDVSDALLGRSETGRQELLVQLNDARRLALRQGNWKYIEEGPGMWDLPEGPGLLFDLNADPGEQHDLSQSDPQRAAAMDQAIKAIRQAPQPQAAVGESADSAAAAPVGEAVFVPAA